MVDVHTKEQRSYNMSKIRSMYTRPERVMEKLLIKKGFRYHPKVYGNPDFINYPKKTVLFIDGCFWHKCPKHFKYPSSNVQFWKNKINENARRDREITLNYNLSGWRVIRIWEHKTADFINNPIVIIK